MSKRDLGPREALMGTREGMLAVLARKDLGTQEKHVLLATVALTAGFQKHSDRIALTQLAKAAGIARRHAAEAWKHLTELGLVSCSAVRGGRGQCARREVRLDRLNCHASGDTLNCHAIRDSIAPKLSHVAVETVTPHVTHREVLRTDITTSANAEPPETRPSVRAEPSLAEAIFQAYPRKVARRKALDVIGREIRRTGKARGCSDAEATAVLLDATRRYALAVAAWPEEDRRFIPHPATWFGQARYEDDPTTWERPGSKATCEATFVGWTPTKSFADLTPAQQAELAGETEQ